MDIFDLSQNSLSIGTLGKAIIILLVLVSAVAAEFYFTHKDIGSQTYYLQGSQVIAFNCNDNPCLATQNVLQVINNQISYPLLVNITYTCNCTVEAHFTYSPPDIYYPNGTIFYQHIIQPNQSMLVITQAIRTSGFDNMTLHVVTQAH